MDMDMDHSKVETTTTTTTRKTTITTVLLILTNTINRRGSIVNLDVVK